MSFWQFIPYDQGGNLADAYNRYCSIVPGDNDWIIIWDGDVMVLTPEWEKVIKDTIRIYPNYTLYTCYTNRVKCRPQLQKDLFHEPDIRKHRKRALELYNTRRHHVKEIRRVISGYCMIFQKKTWKRFPFRGKGIIGIDTYFSRDILMAGLGIGLIEGVYVYHYYKFNEGVRFEPYKNQQK